MAGIRKKTQTKQVILQKKPRIRKQIPQVGTFLADKEEKDVFPRTHIRIIGIGGGGGNIVGEIAKTVSRADFIAANTDVQAQKGLSKNVRLFMFGESLTRGMGCGMDASLGEQAARAEKDKIKKLVEGQDICILVSSLGGGTGSGATTVFAEVAKEAHCLTLGIFTMPFSFEGTKRKQLADSALNSIVPLLNAYLVIPNENIFRIIEVKTPLKESLSAVNKRLAETLEGFIETLSLPGLINIDFADVRTLLEGRGRLAYLQSVQVQGGPKVQLGIKDVLNNPLLDYGIGGADRLIFNVAGDKGMRMQEVAEISRVLTSKNLRAKIIFGLSLQPGYKEKLRISLFAIGCRPEIKDIKSPIQIQKKRKQKKQVVKKSVVVKEKEEQKTLPLLQLEVEASRVRRNALDVKKAQDEEIKELEKKEEAFDIPAFLRKNKL